LDWSFGTDDLLSYLGTSNADAVPAGTASGRSYARDQNSTAFAGLYRPAMGWTAARSGLSHQTAAHPCQMRAWHAWGRWRFSSCAPASACRPEPRTRNPDTSNMPSRQPPLLGLSSRQQTFPPRRPFRRICLPDGNGSNREVIPLVAVDLAGWRGCPRSWTQCGLVTPAPVGWVAGRDDRGCAGPLAAGSSPRGRSLQRLPRPAG